MSGSFNIKYGRQCLLLIVITLFCCQGIRAQQRCSTMEYEAWRKENNPRLEQTQKFEDWLQEKISQKSLSSIHQRTLATVLTIPVVVHVIHNGEAIGQNSNISDAQVISQIEVLNEDFRRLNPDASETLSQFTSVADDMEINFVLAKQDPEGLPTNGIVRAQGGQSNYGLTEGAKLSAISYWPAENYFNIWVANLGGNLLGYAQFPVSTLEGLEDSSNNRLTDGVVLRYQSFGAQSKGDFPSLIAPFHQGRTTTHEVGHFFGLRHIWGDGNCEVDDFCGDTPASSNEHEGCNLNRQSCGQLSMVQNFMDYTDDVCMNLFTTDQKTRMRTVLENSPRRKSLITSPGAIDPIQVADDLGIRKIVSPQQGQCGGNIIPTIEIRNYGINTVGSAKIDLLQDGLAIETKNLTLNLEPLAIQTVTFTTLTSLIPGNYEFSFEVKETNGVTDNNAANNSKNLSFALNFPPESTFSESFVDLPQNWLIQNPDQSIGWELLSAPGESGNDNMAIGIQNFNYSNGFGEIDRLLSPIIDLPQALSATLSFKYAYAQNTIGAIDRLTVSLSTDCGNTFTDLLFDEFGSSLATTTATSESFIPTDKFSWKTINVNLNKYAGNREIQIAFDNQNGNGNNIYLDDISLLLENQFDVDLAIADIINPTAITCESAISPQIRVKNIGLETINSFEASITVNGNTQTQNINAILSPFQTISVTFNEVPVSDGSNNFSFSIANPNNQADDNQGNDQLNFTSYKNNHTEFIPLRQRFQISSLSDTDWIVVNNDNDITWQLTSAQGNGDNNMAAFINGYNYIKRGEEDWLVSPVLDMSNAFEASMTFKVSYAEVDNFKDKLKIFVSTDCGKTFDNLIYIKSGSSLAVTGSNDSWTPSVENDWKTEFVNLSSYAGEQQVRLAFVFENQFGNNIYLDDIEFYLTNNVDFPTTTGNSVVMFPNPTTSNQVNVTFNLEEKEEIRMALISSRGQVVYDKMFANTLNQTYTLEFPQLTNGVYFVKISGSSLNETKKLLLQR